MTAFPFFSLFYPRGKLEYGYKVDIRKLGRAARNSTGRNFKLGCVLREKNLFLIARKVGGDWKEFLRSFFFRFCIFLLSSLVKCLWKRTSWFCFAFIFLSNCFVKVNFVMKANTKNLLTHPSVFEFTISKWDGTEDYSCSLKFNVYDGNLSGVRLKLMVWLPESSPSSL